MVEQGALAEQQTSHDRAVLVVGGGPAGMQAALLLAAAGVQVYLVDRAPAIGGHQPLLDKTFPTDSCGLCFMSPRSTAYCPFVECERDERISVLASTELAGLTGEAGDFTVELLQRTRGVDAGSCTGCGRCAEVCPVTVRSDFGGGIEDRTAVYRPFPQAVPDAYLVDWNACTRCGACEPVCPVGAIDLGREDGRRTVKVGAVILAPGFKPFDAGQKTEFGHGVYPNVVTSVQAERMLSRGGPTGGSILRPSDGTPPGKIAFVQCVGSRDPSTGRNYCSSICCMYAAKQLTLLRERAEGSQVVVFQMDQRAAGKGYDRYLERVQAQPGVEYRRSAVAEVKQVPGSKDLLVRYADDNGIRREEQFSLVVLSVGMEASDGVRDLADRLGLPVNRYGFLESGALFREESPRSGVFVAGGGREPMDVADAVAEGAAAAASAARLLRVGLGDGGPHSDPLSGSLEDGVAPGQEIDSIQNTGGNPSEVRKVGVLLCSCGSEIGGRLDLPALAARVAGWPGVVYAGVADGLCRQEGLEAVREVIRERGANRLVVAACARRKIETPLGSAARRAGLNPGLLELANLREECAWVHSEADSRTETKAEALVSMAVARALLSEPAEEKEVAFPPTALVVGGGAAGLVAATVLAEQGVELWLVERECQLGGALRCQNGNIDGASSGDMLEGLRRRVEGSGRVHLLLESEVTRIDGHLGAFRATVASGGGVQQIDPGVVVLATGVEDASPGQYLLGGHPAVMTQNELERQLSEDLFWPAKHPSVAMVLCAGSLEEGRRYCSRTCCSQAVANALKLREAHPEGQVYLLHREMRTYGFQEEQYEEARRAGVIFLRYDGEHRPVVAANGKSLQVTAREPSLGVSVGLDVNALVLATGVQPTPSDGLASSLGIAVDEDGFLVEANVKTRSTESTRPGVFLCGSCQSPRSLEDTIVHAKAAAMRVLTLLRPGKVVVPLTKPVVNERICSGCGLCVDACAYGARVLDPEKNVSKLIEVLCQGCGACAAVCPNGATQQQGFTGRQMLAALDAALD